MNKELSPMIAYPIILGLVGGLIGFLICGIFQTHWFVILACLVVGLLLGMLIGDRARKKNG